MRDDESCRFLSVGDSEMLPNVNPDQFSRVLRKVLSPLDNETSEVLVSHLVVTNDTTMQSPEDRILDAARRCVDRWGMSKLTIDDVATEANVSRATLYRIFPGGKDVMFDALRVRELGEFFAGMRSSIEPVESLLDFAVKVSVYAMREMRADENLTMMLSTEEGTALKSLTVEGLPRILNVASQYMTPFLTEFVPLAEAEVLVELLARFVISFFLAPSTHFDLADADSAREFFTPFIYALNPAVI
ncbi:MAG: TetR family transcriptional regulator [Actinobacteria bacterium]|nr:TetR family transcriptional regulator [Actinomycetota bacterium]